MKPAGNLDDSGADAPRRGCAAHHTLPSTLKSRLVTLATPRGSVRTVETPAPGDRARLPLADTVPRAGAAIEPTLGALSALVNDSSAGRCGPLWTGLGTRWGHWRAPLWTAGGHTCGQSWG